MFSNPDIVLQFWPQLVQGFIFTLKLTVMAAIGGLVLGTVLALIRLAEILYLSKLVTWWVNCVRSVPLLLVIFWFYFLVPYIAAWLIGSSRPVEVSALASCVVTFIIFEACYFSEIMRAGIQSIPTGQINAGKALGMRYATVMGKIVIPQALRNMLPILLTQAIILFQDVSLVSVLSMKDFFGAADFVAKRDGVPHEMYVTVALVYLICCYMLSRFVTALQRKVAIVR